MLGCVWCSVFPKRPRKSSAAYGVPVPNVPHSASECWIVDLDARAVDVWVAGAATARVERHALVWQPAKDRDALQLDLTALFDCVLDRS